MEVKDMEAMKKIKVGYLPLYLTLYDESDPHYRDPMVEHMNKMIKMLGTHGLEVIQADCVCRNEYEFEKAAEKFNKLGVTAVITHHLAYSLSLASIHALLSLEAPIIVFDTTPDYQLLSVAGTKTGIQANHGIHGVQDMCSILKRNNRPFFMCVGHAFYSDVIEEVVGMCRAAKAAEAFKNMKIGAVGGRYEGMGDFQVLDEQLKKVIGAEVYYLLPETADKYVESVTEEEIDKEISNDRSNYKVETIDEETYRLSTKSGLAIRKWMQDKGLNSCTVNYYHLDENRIPKMPFVECCKMMERCQGFAGEGDALTAGLVGALLEAYPNTMFTEMFCPDWEKDIILMSHMAESNPRLSKWKPIVVDKPFNYNSCGDTVGMYTCYQPGKAVLVNLAPVGDKFSLLLTKVEILDVTSDVSAYRETTQGWLKPCKPIRAFLKEYSMNGATHHSALVYDADIEELKAFGIMMGFDVVEIK